MDIVMVFSISYRNNLIHLNPLESDSNFTLKLSFILLGEFFVVYQ